MRRLSSVARRDEGARRTSGRPRFRRPVIVTRADNRGIRAIMIVAGYLPFNALFRRRGEARRVERRAKPAARAGRRTGGRVCVCTRAYVTSRHIVSRGFTLGARPARVASQRRNAPGASIPRVPVSARSRASWRR